MNLAGRPRVIGAAAVAVVAAMFLGACADKTPVRIGFLGGVSGRVADLGVAGRNGVQLAVETVNARGGLGGRKVELLSRDDEQNPDLAKRRFVELADANVVAVIGPMTSAMAAAVVPLANERKLLLISPTSAANELGGHKDYFMRVISSTRIYADLSARYQYEVTGMRKVALIRDQRNRSYTESWSGDFRASFLKAGGSVVFDKGFESGDDAGLAKIVEAAFKSGPDGVILVANSVDAAILAQQVRMRSPTLPIATAEWAATERFVELAGKAADGVVMAQFVDRNSPLPAYVEFRQRYLGRFGDEPGFAGVAGYDAAMVLLTALERGPAAERSPRESILAIGKFSGLQGMIEFDNDGDASRTVFVTRVVDGRYVAMPRNRTDR